MVTIKNTQFTSNLSLAAILNVLTKVEMLKICEKLDLYVSPNLKKDETARRVAQAILDSPEDVLHGLNKQELQIVDEFVKQGANHYVVRKARKMPYKLQKYGLVVTFFDSAKSEWHMLMPDTVRESLAPYYEDYLDMAEAGTKLPSKKQLRMMAAMRAFLGKDDE
jgi:hypothetical protein